MYSEATKLCDQVKSIFSGGLNMLATTFASINHITALRINFMLRATEVDFNELLHLRYK